MSLFFLSFSVDVEWGKGPTWTSLIMAIIIINWKWWHNSTVGQGKNWLYNVSEGIVVINFLATINE